ncbi:solute carrier, TRAMD3 or PAT1-domain-containing protein [Tribonema minus]|uniref:Cilia- and flagella-associated protein 91 n=1 Tax=Tribonema minus TaxID=303371 RepID=A0A835ZDB6_9STRA|nr:solute carrier, TRAMD3 or PAT1-domain-containing protein [Tribonema minus]
MSRFHVMESRALDHRYDTVFASPLQDNAAYKAKRPSLDASGGVGGRNTYKYFKRPIVPLLNAASPNVGDPKKPPTPEEEPYTREAGTQTLYRESDAQTDPYSPEFAVPEGVSEPELLMLQGLGAGAGLPVGLQEVELLEHARERRRVEASLPPSTDEASLMLRKKLMEEQEVRELRLRASELDRIAERRLEVLRRAMAERDQGNQFLAEQRIEALRQRKVQERERQRHQTQHRRLKVLRKLAKARESMDKKLRGSETRKKRDIIADYADFGSGVYAPVQREGRRLDRDAAKFDILQKTAPITTYQKAASLHSKARREALAASAELAKLDALFRSRRMAAEGLFDDAPKLGTTALGATALGGTMLGATASLQSTVGSTWRRKAQRVERPETPRVEAAAESEDAAARAVLLLQRLLRGRAVQNAMFQGRAKFRELIAELRVADQIEHDGAFQESAVAEAAAARKEAVRFAAMEAMAGSVISAVVQALQEQPL